MAFPDGSMLTNPARAGDLGLMPGSGGSPREGSGHPLQYSCPENPVDRGAWWAAGRGVKKESATIEQLNNKQRQIHTGTDSLW